MKRFSIALALSLFLIVGATIAYGGSAYDASFTTSVTYQNLGDADANVQFMFYDSDSQVTTVNRALNSQAGASLYVGSVSDVGAGFEGSGVVVADQPIAATMVQISSDPDVRVRPISNGFTEGSNEVLLATVLKARNNTTSRFSVQNAQGAGGSNVDITVKLYDADNPTAAPITVTRSDVPAGSARYFDMGNLSQVPTGFNGSAVIEATGPIVATVMELKTNSGLAASYEGVSQGSMVSYMPSALCKYNGSATTAYAVQNSGDGVANVTVTYTGGATSSASIQPGAKYSFQTCGANADGYIGSARIDSTGSEIIAIGKVFGGGRSATFSGAATGSSTLAMPYVRFTDADWRVGGKQRAYIAIQNVGDDLPANSVTAKYVDKDGNVVATQTFGAIANSAKVNTNAGAQSSSSYNMKEFGYVEGFGGGVIVEGPAGSELVSTVRILTLTNDGTAAEDYNGIPVD